MSAAASRAVRIFLGLLMMLTACSGEKANDDTGSDGDGASESPQGTDDIEINAEGDAALGAGSFDLPDPTVGLDSLATYTATLTLSFSGTDAGQPSEWSRTYTMLVGADPAVRQLTIVSAGNVADPEPVLMAEVAGTAYEQRGDAVCTAGAIVPDGSLGEVMEPASFLAGMFGAEAAGESTTNGIATAEYMFDGQALGEAGLGDTTGELSVATDGGYLVKYARTTTSDVYFGEGIDGTATWTYELVAIGEPVAIVLPVDCPSGFIEAPLLPDATDVVASPGVTSYLTAATPADVAAFYQAELLALNWQQSGEPVIVGTLAVINLVRGDERLRLIASIDASGTAVLLTLGSI